MSRLHILIADSNGDYLERLVNFLMLNYSQRFYVHSFTNLEALLDHLAKSREKYDMLLITPDLYSGTIPPDAAGMVIFLAEGRILDIEGIYSVNKYQQGDLLVGNILGIYSEKFQNRVVMPCGRKSTRVVGVYSPAGGTGKTSVAVSLSIQCAQMEMTAFYLNTETVQSTPVFLNCGTTGGLSSIFYYLREKNKNLAMKIEGTRCIDPQFNIHYFTPPDCAAEMDEVLPEEMGNLIRCMREMCEYDVIIVDMSCSLDERNMALLEACDKVFLVLADDAVSRCKANNLVNTLEILAGKRSVTLAHKIDIILNRCREPRGIDQATPNFGGYGIAAELPFVEVLAESCSTLGLIDTGNGFGREMARMAGKIKGEA